MSTVTWVTPAGTLGTIPEGVFYSIPLVATDQTETVFYRLIAGSLPPGIQIDQTGVLSGSPTPGASLQGVPQNVTQNTTSEFAVRAFTREVINGVTVITGLADRTFRLTISNQSKIEWITPAGSLGTYIDGVQIQDIQVQFEDLDFNNRAVVNLIAGSLPPGLTINTRGVISGYLTPNLEDVETNYSFTLRVSNGVTNDVRTFSILVYARNLITADTTFVTADNTVITADITNVEPPIITTPTGSIGSTRSDNFFAFKFNGLDFGGNAFEYIATTGLPPGLTLDPNSGWLYGYIPFLGLSAIQYDFEIIVREVVNTANSSDPYAFSLEVTGPISSEVTWLTPTDSVERDKDPSNLGFIDNGDTSTFYVAAQNASGIQLQYQLLSGSASRLPQGLQLLPSGNIAGRVSFDTFTLDSGTTTFDIGVNTVADPTTFDLVCEFTVNAYSVNGLISVNKNFSITVVRRYQEPYDNLYIQAMPPRDDRDIIDNLLQDSTVFPTDLIYRFDDPNFGVATKVVYNHAYGLTAATLDDYVNSLNLNHYWKNLTLGEIKTARALDDDGNVLYEVVYSQIIDDLVNNQGTSVGKQVLLPFAVDAGDSSETTVVYPNSLQNMRDQVIDDIGQISNVLPRWMLSRQQDGSVLGFVLAWVIAYTKPGESGQIAYNIQNYFAQQQENQQLNTIDFEVDRYELDNFLTKNWNRQDQYWGFDDSVNVPHPPSLTTFDLFGVPPFSPTTSYVVGDVVIYQTVENGYRISKLYECIQNTTPGILPTNVSYWSPTGQALASWKNDSNIITTWEDNLQTLATWTYATRGATGVGTTFDGNSLLFTAPVDMYAQTRTTEYDKYLVFPKRNILE